MTSEGLKAITNVLKRQLSEYDAVSRQLSQALVALADRDKQLESATALETQLHATLHRALTELAEREQQLLSVQSYYGKAQTELQRVQGELDVAQAKLHILASKQEGKPNED